MNHEEFCLDFFLAFFTVASAAAAEPLVLEKMGIMFVGGREVAMTGAGRFGGGNQIVDQAPVHFFSGSRRKKNVKANRPSS